MKKTNLRKPEEKYKIAAMTVLLIGTCFLTFYCHSGLKIETIFTHFFYIPIILASLWWQRRGLWIAVFLAAVLIVSHKVLRGDLPITNDYLRAFMFIVTAWVVAILRERIIKREKEILWEREKRVTQIIQGSSVPIFVIDNQHFVTHWNKACENLTGIPAEKIVGTRKQWRAFYPEERPTMVDLIVDKVSGGEIRKYYGDKYQKAVLIDGGYEAQDFFSHLGKEGKWLFFSAAPLKDTRGDTIGAMEILQDVTERKRIEEEKKAEETMEMKSQFISLVSHELRTPLTAIKESIGIVFDETAGSLNADQKDFLDAAKRNVDRLARLINDVLDFQKVESDKIKFHAQPNDINEVIRIVKRTMAPLAKKKGLDFVVKLDEKLPNINFDKDRITQVAIDIIDNAIKFTERGSITINTSKAGNNIQVSVLDTGIGIKETDIAKLFHSFEQIETAKGEKRGGTGLGLAISREIIEKHNGKIWVESEYNRGSNFSFLLPIKERREQNVKKNFSS